MVRKLCFHEHATHRKFALNGLVLGHLGHGSAIADDSAKLFSGTSKNVSLDRLDQNNVYVGRPRRHMFQTKVTPMK